MTIMARWTMAALVWVMACAMQGRAENTEQDPWASWQPIASLRYSYPLSGSVELGLAVDCRGMPWVGDQQDYYGYASCELAEKGYKIHVGVADRKTADETWEPLTGYRIGVTYLEMNEGAKGVDPESHHFGVEAVGSLYGIQLMVGGEVQLDGGGVLVSVGIGVGI